MDKTAKERMKRYREKKRNETVTENPDSVTVSVTEGEESVMPDVTQYPAILHALVDPEKRLKLEKIYRSLKEHNVEKIVYYGYPGMVPFDTVGELLEATR